MIIWYNAIYMSKYSTACNKHTKEEGGHRKKKWGAHPKRGTTPLRPAGRHDGAGSGGTSGTVCEWIEVDVAWKWPL
jgi:hypothetical protein